MNPKIRKETSFLEVAVNVTAALGDIDRRRTVQRVLGGNNLAASEGVRRFFEKVGSRLFYENSAIVDRLKQGQTVLNLDPKGASKKTLTEHGLGMNKDWLNPCYKN
jgi:hypothetical protein